MDQAKTDLGTARASAPSANFTRREWLACGAGACVLGAAGGGSFLGRLFRLATDEVPAEIFKGDAPNAKTWELWQKRGWVKEAAHCLQLDRNTQCKICPNNCLLSPGDRSHCRNRVNIDGRQYTMAYANPCTFHVDPVEKKPLYHYMPGTRTFSLAESGCVFRCLNCQNWEISQKKPEETKDPRGPELRLRVPLPDALTYEDLARISLFPDDLPGVAAALRCPSVSYTYSEPTAWYEYAADCCRSVRAAGLKNILVTCGSIEERPLRELLAWVDAAHVDLKGFSEEVYRDLNSGRLETILRTLRLYHELGVWFEIINLVVPTYTDDLDGIRRMCAWIVETLGPDRPLHFSRFQPQHKLEHLAPTPVATLVRARDIAREEGLHFVYIGNVRDVPDAGTTFCPQCRRAVVERDIFAVTKNALDHGRCPDCGTVIAGVW